MFSDGPEALLHNGMQVHFFCANTCFFFLIRTKDAISHSSHMHKQTKTLLRETACPHTSANLQLYKIFEYSVLHIANVQAPISPKGSNAERQDENMINHRTEQ